RYCELTGHPQPEVFHTNEGHAGFLGLERANEILGDPAGRDLDFDEVLPAVRAGTVFTTHTPVPAGIDRFPVDLVQHYFGDGALVPHVEPRRILALGAEENPGMFNMAHMGLRLAQRANGVSRLHGRVSRAMFNGLWPGFDADEVPIGSITNGVHAPSWAAPPWLQLGRDLAEADSFSEPAAWQRLQEVDPVALWSIRSRLRSLLVDEVRLRLLQSGLERGASEAELG